MRVRVRLFAGMKDRLGAGEILLEDLPPDATVADARAAIESRCPGLRGFTAAAAVNLEYADASRRLRDGDEVAFIPPVSGG